MISTEQASGEIQLKQEKGTTSNEFMVEQSIDDNESLYINSTLSQRIAPKRISVPNLSPDTSLLHCPLTQNSVESMRLSTVTFTAN